MSDRIKGFTVLLEQDAKDEDFEAIEQAVLMIRGVARIRRSIAAPDDWMNRERVRRELGEKLWAVLYPKEKEPE